MLSFAAAPLLVAAFALEPVSAVTPVPPGAPPLAPPFAPPLKKWDGDSFAIEKVRVAGSGEPRENMTLLLRDGRIVAIGADVVIPPEAERIDGTGLTVMPGFIDGFSDLGLASNDKTPPAVSLNEGLPQDYGSDAFAETAEANRKGLLPERRGRDLLQTIDKDAAEKLRLAGFTAVCTAPAEGLLMGQACLIDLSARPLRNIVITEPALLAARFRGGGRDGGYPSTLMGVLAHLRQAFLDARRLSVWRDGWRHRAGIPRPPDDGCLETLERAMDGELRVAFAVDRASDILRALDFAKEFGLKAVIVGGKEGFKVADRLAAERVPVIASLAIPDAPERKGATIKKPEAKPDAKSEARPNEKPNENPDEKPDAKPEAGKKEEALPAKPAEPPPAAAPPAPAAAPLVADAVNATDAGHVPVVPNGPAVAEEWEVKDPVLAEPLELFEERRKQWEDEVRNVEHLLAAGVTVALTTRGSSGPNDFVSDLRVAVEKGLDPKAAVKAMTETAAELFGVDQEYGAVRVGMAADLILVEGELASKERAVRHIFAGGRHFEGAKKKEEADKDAKKDAKGETKEGTPPPTALDLTGTWEITGNEGFKSKLTLTQKGSELSGKLESEMGEAKVTSGTLEGDQFKIVVTAEFQNQKFEFKLSGTATKDELTGTFETPFGEPAAFTAKRGPGGLGADDNADEEAHEAAGCNCGAHPEDGR